MLQAAAEQPQPEVQASASQQKAAAAAGTGAGSSSASRNQQAWETGAGKTAAAGIAAAAGGEEEGDDDDVLHPDDWDDILATWMSAVGLGDALAGGNTPADATAAASSPNYVPGTGATAARAAAQQQQLQTASLQASSSAAQHPGAASAAAEAALAAGMVCTSSSSSNAASGVLPGQEQAGAAWGHGMPGSQQQQGARAFLSVVPEMDAYTANTLPLLGHHLPEMMAQPQQAASSLSTYSFQQEQHLQAPGPSRQAAPAAAASSRLAGVPAWLAGASDSEDEGSEAGSEGSLPAMGFTVSPFLPLCPCMLCSPKRSSGRSWGFRLHGDNPGT